MNRLLRYVSGMFNYLPEGCAVSVKMLRRPAVEAMTGLGRSSIYDLMSRGKFPRPIKLTAKAVGWPESVIQDWLEERIAATPDAAT